MATSEQKQELVEDIKKPIRHYRVTITGYGGEHVYGSLTREQFEYWKNRENELSEYVVEPQAHPDLLESVSFLKKKSGENDYYLDWWEYDDVDHFHGAEHYSSSILIEELDSDDYDAEIIDTVYEDTLEEFLDEYDADTIIDESDSLINKDKKPIVGMCSIEKGTFFEARFSTQGRIDFSKLEFFATETLSDTILTSINYDDEDLDNEGGDTTGKGFHVVVYDD